ncbi:MAG: MBL fold metallo-hydrolase [Verrucomicrobiota bacterium]
MKVKLWGTRGSIPTPSTETFKTYHFGGETTCLSIDSGNQIIIFDAGSGIRQLGLDFMKRKLTQATFFFTHVHWDHIQGFPFFIPAFIPSNQFQMYGPCLQPDNPQFIGSILEKALRGQQNFLTFPVTLDQMPAKMVFKDLAENITTEIPVDGGKLIIRPRSLNHPGGSFGYRIEEHLEGKPLKVFTIATDTEHQDDLNPNIQDIAKDSDLMIYDCQYTEDEYHGKVGGMPKHGWGHSTWNWGLKESKAAGVKHLVMFHHDPLHNDETILQMEKDAQTEGKKMGIQVSAARQFAEFDL